MCSNVAPACGSDCLIPVGATRNRGASSSSLSDSMPVTSNHHSMQSKLIQQFNNVNISLGTLLDFPSDFYIKEVKKFHGATGSKKSKQAHRLKQNCAHVHKTKKEFDLTYARTNLLISSTTSFFEHHRTYDLCFQKPKVFILSYRKKCSIPDCI